MSANKPSQLTNNLDISEGAILGNFYKVEAFLGQGAFGSVTKCVNTKTNKAMAIKVNKNDTDILELAKLEVFILEQLRCFDPDRCNIVKWNGFFHDGEHICLKFELLDQCLFDYIEEHNDQGLPMSELRPILYQLTNALSYLSSMGIVHTDLKTDNVMVVDRHQSPIKVKIIDFGLARPVSSLVPGDSVQSLWYRAPEVMIGAPFNQAIDMWSLGVIAVELATGLPLYPGETEFDTFRFIIHTQGQPPDCVLDRGFDTEYFFTEENCGDQRWKFKSEKEFHYDAEEIEETLDLHLNSLDDLEQVLKQLKGHQSGQDLFVSLIKQMLHLDANQRITPAKALRHPFFSDPDLSQNSSRDTHINKGFALSQQLSYCQSKNPHNIDCSVRNPVDLTEETPFKMSANKSSFLPNDLDISEGAILGNAYKVEAFLGDGAFGFVTKCVNTKTKKAVAIKVYKNKPDILERAKLEVFILEQLQCLDPDRCNIVKWNGFFQDGEHICLKFELLDQCLFDYLAERNNQGLSMSELRPFLCQLTNALSYLSSMRIVHTDLKTDNVMVVDRHQSPIKVKIIDFGLARPVSSLVPGDCVQILWYRAPEVMIGAPFNQAIDMWSLGVIAVELATGLPLYPGETEFDTLRFIIDTQGQPPDCVLDRGFDTNHYFIEENCGDSRWKFKSEEEFENDTGEGIQETRYFTLESLDDLEQYMKEQTGHQSGQDLFVSLVKQMLHLDANRRITPVEALQHPFFDLPQSSPRDNCTKREGRGKKDNTDDQSLILYQQPSHPSIHPFSSAYPGPGRGGRSLSRGSERSTDGSGLLL